MQLTPDDKAILRAALAHGSYRPGTAANVLRCVRLAENLLLAENDNYPGTYTLTSMGEQLVDALELVS